MSDTYQLLILGNGFDLHCGLKTRYADFFKSEILDMTTIDFGVIKMQTECFGFWEGLLFKYYQLYGDIDYKWCNIETIIKDTLVTIYCKDLWYTALSDFQSHCDPEEYIRQQDNIQDYLLYKCVKFFYNHSHVIKIKSDDNYMKVLTLYLIKELNNFENRFCQYVQKNIINPNDTNELNTTYLINTINLLTELTNFTDKIYHNISEMTEIVEKMKINQGVPLSKLPSWGEVDYEEYTKLSSEFNTLKNTRILSFNYTSLFDILEFDAPCKYSNVHGKLCKSICKTDCKGSNIIFGVDDNFVQEHSEFPELRLFSKTYRKMKSTSEPLSILPPKENSKVEIKFYGHSLSEADYSYFQSIFDYYSIYSNTNVSLIFYYSKGYEQTDAIYDLINAYGKTLTNKDQGKNLTHKLLLENRLKIVEID